jgi:hypothetical protein
LEVFKGEFKRLGFRRFISHKMREMEEERDERKEGKKRREEKRKKKREKKNRGRLREVGKKD